MESQVTQLLEKVKGGDRDAQDELMRLAYSELHRIAQGHLRNERQSHTLQPTALVNEAYLRIFSEASPKFADRSHFLALMSLVMRRVLVDHARARSAARRGGNEAKVSLDDNMALQADADRGPIEMLELDMALQALARRRESLARFIEMRYFGGMTAEEIAEVSGESVHVVNKDLRFAQAWLRRKLTGA